MRVGAVAMGLIMLVALTAAAQSETVDFGAVSVGMSGRATYTFRNGGPFSCAIESIGFGEASFLASGPFRIEPPPLPATVESGGAVQWVITYRPTSAGTHSETMTVRIRCGIFGQTLSVPLYGRTSASVSDTTPTATVAQPTDITSTAPSVSVVPQTQSCPCAAEIQEIETELVALSLRMHTQLTPAVAQLSTELASLADCCASEANQLDGPVPLGPFASEGGARFDRFLSSYRRLTLQSAGNFPLIDPEEEVLQRTLEQGSEILYELVDELDAIATIVGGLSQDERASLDTYIPPASVEFLDVLYDVGADPSMHPKLQGLLGSTGQSTGETILNKIEIWVDQIPVVGGILSGLIKDARELADNAENTLAIAGLLFQYEIELKLDAMIRGLFGIDIPPNATESQLRELLRRISGEPLTERLDRLANGQAQMAGNLDQLDRDLESIGERVDEVERIVGENQQELDTIERKICCLVLSLQDYAEQMGLALYGDRGAFDFMVPDVCRHVTISDCTYRTGVLPSDDRFDAIKPEIRALEADMDWVRQTLEEILRRLGGQPIPTVPIPDIPDVPDIPDQPRVPGEATPWDWLLITKKIYVYAEDTFHPTSRSDVHDVVVETPAFDVSGWVDLWELRPGDSVEIELWIEVDERERHFMTTTFEGGPGTRLVYFDELSGGRPFIVGDRIRITFQQTTSADGYLTVIPIGYQFIVQSQR